MQRNLGLVRKILFKMENDSGEFDPKDFATDGFTENQVCYHVWLLGQAELMRVIETTNHGDAAPRAIPVSLTWTGHDFLDAARSDTTWAKAMEKVKTAGGNLTFAIVKQLLELLIKVQLGL